MQINYDSERPIFQQIAEGIEDAILQGAFREGDQVPSITEFSVRYTINPATALKGINILVDNNILYKKRGVGMFVAEGALDILRKNRRQGFHDRYVMELVREAKRLDISGEELKGMLESAFKEEPAAD